jgi:ADP-heptose:LPS heptosyltransferase
VAHRREAELCLGSLELNSSLPILACTPTTRQETGEWPSAFFAEVISRAVSEQPANVVFFGAAQDVAALHAISHAIPHPTRVVAGTLGWLAFAEALRMCDALLAMDSGPRHLANAVGTRVAFTRNLSFSHIEAGAYCANETDLAPPLAECSSAGDVAAVAKSASVRDAAERVVGLLRARG